MSVWKSKRTCESVYEQRRTGDGKRETGKGHLEPASFVGGQKIQILETATDFNLESRLRKNVRRNSPSDISWSLRVEKMADQTDKVLAVVKKYIAVLEKNRIP